MYIDDVGFSRSDAYFARSTKQTITSFDCLSIQI
jgi:hypothetical protein